MPDLPNPLNVLVIRDEAPASLERIASVAPGRLRVTGLWHSLLPELRRDWPGDLIARFTRTSPDRVPTAEEAEAVIRGAHAVMMGVPFPRDGLERMADVRWVHWGFAGLSNVRGSSFWGAPVLTTSSRGYTGAQPIAESALAGLLALARGIHTGVQHTVARSFEPSSYNPIVVQGKTLGIIGLGGIGRALARMAKGMGMRVVATRRSAAEREEGVQGVDVLYPAAQMHEMLAGCQMVAVCAMWTHETEGLVDAAAFGAMPEGAFIANVARGEIIDEPAMIAALESGKLGGAYLDVYTREFTVPPPEALLSHPHVIMSPHISQKSDVNHLFGLDLFCANLRRLLDGEELENVVDWERGY